MGEYPGPGWVCCSLAESWLCRGRGEKDGGPTGAGSQLVEPTEVAGPADGHGRGGGLQPAGPAARASWRADASPSTRGSGRCRAALWCPRGAEGASAGGWPLATFRAGSQGRTGAAQQPSTRGGPQVPSQCTSRSLSHRSPSCQKGLSTHILLRSDHPAPQVCNTLSFWGRKIPFTQM